MVSQVENSDWLQWIERLVGGPVVPARTSELPRALYHCCLDEQPDFLVPQRYLKPAGGRSPSDRRLIFNPECSFEQPNLPAFSHEHFACGQTANSHVVVWVKDAATRSVIPFWLGPQLGEWLTATDPGETIPEEIPVNRMAALQSAGIAVEADYAATQRAAWQQEVERSQAPFRERGYVPVGRLIHPFHIAAMRRYYRYHLRHGSFQLGDGQSECRFVAHNQPVASFFHHQLAERLSDIAGEALKPSYCYFSSYREGSVLAKHTDRAQCEFSVSLCVDYSPEPELATPWPLRLHIEGGEVQVFQGLGDGLLYRGRQIPHSRSRLGAGQSSTSIFFHFVRENFDSSLR